MPHAQLWVLHSRPIVILLQSTPIGKLLILQLLPVITVFILSVVGLNGFITDPRHSKPERIIARLLQQRSAIMYNTQIIKEHVLMLIHIAEVNIQISAIFYRNTSSQR